MCVCVCVHLPVGQLGVVAAQASNIFWHFLLNFSGIATKFSKKSDSDNKLEEQGGDDKIIHDSNINAYLEEKGDNGNKDPNDAKVNEHGAHILEEKDGSGTEDPNNSHASVCSANV